MKKYGKKTDFIHRLIKTDSDEALILVSGLGASMHEQREAFVARFADKKQLNYMSLDCTKKALQHGTTQTLEEDAVKIIAEQFPNKKLLFSGACFGGMMSLRLANRFASRTQLLIITSPTINYSKASLLANMLHQVASKKRFCKGKEAIQKLLIFEQLIRSSENLFNVQTQLYIGQIVIFHPEKDRFVPLENSVQMHSALARENVTLNILPNETHRLINDFRLQNPLRILSDYLQKTRNN